MGLQELLVLASMAFLPAPAAQEVHPFGIGYTRADVLAEGDYVHEDGSYFDCYQLQGSAGDRVVISMTSEDLDPLLILVNGNNCASENVIDMNDDGGDGLNARLVVTLPSGTNWVRTSTSGSGAKAGRYVLDTGWARD